MRAARRAGVGTDRHSPGQFRRCGGVRRLRAGAQLYLGWARGEPEPDRVWGLGVGAGERAVNVAQLHALAGPVVAAVGDAPVFSLLVEDVCGHLGTELAAAVEIQADDWRAARLLADRLGLEAVECPPSLVMFAAERPRWRCLVTVYAAAPRGDPHIRKLDGGAATRGADDPGGNFGQGPAQDGGTVDGALGLVGAGS